MLSRPSEVPLTPSVLAWVSPRDSPGADRSGRVRTRL